MKKTFFILTAVMLAALARADFALASAQGDMVNNRIQAAVQGDCNSAGDNGGVRYCGCMIKIDGTSYNYKLCKTRSYAELAPGYNFSVNLETGVCKIDASATIQLTQTLNCGIKREKIPDGCQCNFTPSPSIAGDQATRVFLEFTGGPTPRLVGDKPLTQHQYARLDDLLSHNGDLLSNSVCPIEEKRLFGVIRMNGLGDDGSKWDCSKPAYKDVTRCCCTEQEKGSATTKYSCEKVTGFDNACGGAQKVYPLGSDGTCNQYATTGKVTADKQNPGIGQDKLLSEALTLNQLGHIATPSAFIGRVIQVMLSLLGSIALGLYVWSGVLWTTAAGNSERIETSKKIIIWTTAGVAAILSSYVLVQFIFKTLG